MDLKQAWKKKVLSAAAGLEPAELVLKKRIICQRFYK